MGAVAISIGQTVIYPRATPGGMRIIGRTPVKLFQLDHPALTLFRPGDRVLFRAVSQAEFLAIEEEAAELMMGVEVKKDV
jgi:allophanate hydrolase subunit 1